MLKTKDHVEDQIVIGVHFDHQTKKWNPRMTRYIFIKRKGVHILDLTQTTRLLSEACDLSIDVVAEGKGFLLVGTKYEVAHPVASPASQSCYHYVNEKWLGGTLTNRSTTETRLRKFQHLRDGEDIGGFD